MNRVGEALLYTCANDPTATLAEARIESAPYALIKYRAVRDVMMADIGSQCSERGFPTLGARAAHQALRQFQRIIFYGAAEDSGSYALSELLAKALFDLPAQDAWFYESALVADQLNVAFKAKQAHACLEVVGVAVGLTYVPGRVSAEVFGLADSDSFQWGSMESAAQKTAFPEFSPPPG